MGQVLVMQEATIIYNNKKCIQFTSKSVSPANENRLIRASPLQVFVTVI